MFILSANIILANAPLYPFRVCVIFPSILSRPEGVKNLVICHRWLAGHGEWSAKIFSWGEFFAQCFSDFRVGHGSKTNIESGS